MDSFVLIRRRHDIFQETGDRETCSLSIPVVCCLEGPAPDVSIHRGPRPQGAFMQRKKLVIKKVFCCLLACVLFACPAFAAMSDAKFIDLCGSGSLQKIIAAIDNGADVNATDNNGFTPLMAAADSNSNPKVITVLVEAGANVNAKDLAGWSPLMMAAVTNNLEVMSALVKAGADVNASNNHGWTPLMLTAAFHKNPEAVKLLIRAGADVNAKADELPGGTPLLSAVCGEYRSTPKIVSALIEAGANVNTKDAGGMTPLLLAARCSTPEIITTLIQAGAEVNKEGKGAAALLILALIRYDPASKVLETLVKAGVDVNARNKTGATPLIHAAQNSKATAIITLLDLGADPNLTDDYGKAAIDYARENIHLKDTQALQRLKKASK